MSQSLFRIKYDSVFIDDLYEIVDGDTSQITVRGEQLLMLVTWPEGSDSQHLQSALIDRARLRDVTLIPM